MLVSDLFINMSAVVDCALWVLIYESPARETDLNVKIKKPNGVKEFCNHTFHSPCCFEKRELLVKLSRETLEVIGLKEHYKKKIMRNISLYKKFSNIRNEIAHGIPIGISKPGYSNEDEQAIINYEKEIKDAVKKDHMENAFDLHKEISNLGTYRPYLVINKTKKAHSYKINKNISENVSILLNLVLDTLNIALLDSRITHMDTENCA